MNDNNFSTNQNQIKDLDIPPLLPYAQLTPEKIELATSAGKYLDTYTIFASDASPLTPHSFHTSAALYLGSLVIARRLVLKVGVMSIYPNLYQMYIGPSTKDRKTTALAVTKGVIKAAEIDYLLIADRQTPEALGIDLSFRVPTNYSEMDQAQKDLWLKERAFAGQRGWCLEEASHLFDSFNRDYTSGLLPIILDLYDSPDQGPKRNTVTRGRESISNPYISIFGCSTYSAMDDHLRNKIHWNNGLWARIAFQINDGTGVWKFWPPPMSYPSEVIDPIKFIATKLFPTPIATIDSIKKEGKQISQSEQDLWKINVTPLKSCEVIINPVAWKQWELYSKATSYDMISNDLPDKLHANYGRLGTMLIKVAMILATFDAESLPITIQPKHVYRAQMIVEDWRTNLHKLLFRIQNQALEKESLEELVYNIIATSGIGWISRRNVLMNSRVKLEKLEPIIKNLVDKEKIEVQNSNGSRGPSSEGYRLLL